MLLGVRQNAAPEGTIQLAVRSDHHNHLAHRVVASNRGAGKAHLFLALHAHESDGKTGGDLEEQELLMLTRENLDQALDQGKILSLGFATLLGIGLRRLDQLTRHMRP